MWKKRKNYGTEVTIHAISNLNTFEIDSIIINIIFSTSKRYR